MITTLLLRDKSYFELVALIDQKLHSEVLNISDCSDQTALRVFVEPECPPSRLHQSSGQLRSACPGMSVPSAAW